MNAALGIIFSIVSMFGFGIGGFLFGKTVKAAGGLKTIIWVETSIALLFLVAFVFYQQPVIIDAETLILTVLITSFGAIAFFSLAKGLKEGHISIVYTIASSWGIATLLLSLLFFKEPLTTKQLFCVFLIMIGIILTSFKQGSLLRLNAKSIAKGTGYAVITLFCWGVFYFLSSILTSKVGWFLAAFFYAIPVSFLFFVYGLITKTKFAVPKNALSSIFAASLLLFIAALAYNIGVANYYTSIVAPITSAAPVITVTLALFFLKEKLEISQFIGIFLVIFGIILLSF